MHENGQDWLFVMKEFMIRKPHDITCKYEYQKRRETGTHIDKQMLEAI